MIKPLKYGQLLTINFSIQYQRILIGLEARYFPLIPDW